MRLHQLSKEKLAAVANSSTVFQTRDINCNVCAILQGEKAAFCAYEPPYAKVCSPAQLRRLYSYFLGRAKSGSQWAEGMLRLTPCDLWPFIERRTMWLLGDSTTEVFHLCSEKRFMQCLIAFINFPTMLLIAGSSHADYCNLVCDGSISCWPWSASSLGGMTLEVQMTPMAVHLLQTTQTQWKKPVGGTEANLQW